MHNFVMMEDHAIHYLSLNQEQGNQKGLDLLFARASKHGQMLEWRRMYMGLLRKDGMILGFVRMKVGLLWTDLVSYIPRMKMPDCLRRINICTRQGEESKKLTCRHSSVADATSI